jgi:hypothetical protein
VHPIDLDKLCYEVLNRSLIRFSATAAGNDADGPTLERSSVGGQELLLLEIPASLMLALSVLEREI